MDDASRPKTQREIERGLEAELSYARRVFEQASHVLTQQLTASQDMSPQDWVVYLRSMRQQADQAYANYQVALRRFTEFAAYGTIPSSTEKPAERDGSDPFSGAASA